MAVKKRLSIEEKLQIFIKRTKVPNIKWSMFICIFLTLILLSTGLVKSKFNNSVQALALISDSKSNEKLSCVFVGDIMFGRSVENVAEKYGYEHLLRNVTQLLKGADYVTGNFESAVLLKDEEYYKKEDKNIHLFSKKESVKALKDANFTVLNLANNHIVDYGEEGLKDTLSVLKENNIPYVGAGRDVHEAERYNITEINGIRIATLGFGEVNPKNFKASDIKGGILVSDPETFLRLIEEADKKADLVIVHNHWGEEYENIQNPKQEKFARVMVDAGADIVVGHHPHVLQPIEVYNDSLILYSLGNFVFDQGWSKTKDSALVNYKLHENGTGEFSIAPMRINEGTPNISSNSYHTKRIFNTLTKKLQSDKYYFEDGRLIIKLDNSRVVKSSIDRKK